MGALRFKVLMVLVGVQGLGLFKVLGDFEGLGLWGRLGFRVWGR